MPEPKMCSKCGENPATQKHAWCNSCKAKYQRGYEGIRAEQAEKQAFARGAEAMRRALVKALNNLPREAMVRNREVQLWIFGSPAPAFVSAEPPAVNGTAEPAAAISAEAQPSDALEAAEETPAGPPQT